MDGTAKGGVIVGLAILIPYLLKKFY